MLNQVKICSRLLKAVKYGASGPAALAALAAPPEELGFDVAGVDVAGVEAEQLAASPPVAPFAAVPGPACASSCACPLPWLLGLV